jgi:O-antigen/teichoic acid export membrane protein
MRAFARDAFLWTAGALLHERLDVLLVAALAGPEDVAIYGVATAVGARTRVVGLAAGGALHPHLAAMGAAEARAVGARALRGNALVAVGLAALVAMAAPAVPWIWGPAYAGSVWVVWVLLPGSVLASLVTLAGRVLQALDRQRVVVAAQFASLAVGLAATGLLVPGYGSLGAAAGSTIGAAAGAVALWAGWPPRDG